jgi:hypothetical protein
VILRAILTLAGLAALVGSILVGRPERFGITATCGLVVVVAAAGAIAADAVPLRRIRLACSCATLALGVVLLVARGEVHVPVAAAIVLLQVAAVAAQTAGGASRIVWPR